MQVKLTYFSDTGLFYSRDSYASRFKDRRKIYDEVLAKATVGKLPGLVEGTIDKIVLIELPQLEPNWPRVIFPKHMRVDR